MKIKALVQEFRSDAELEENGKWAPIVEGVEFKIRRMRSKTVSKARDNIYGPFERAMGARKKDLPDAVELDCTLKLLSTAVIVDWRGEGMVDDDGAAIPFTADNCRAVLADEESGKDLRAAVINLAMDGEFFSPDAEDVKIDEGNSSNTSNGV